MGKTARLKYSKHWKLKIQKSKKTNEIDWKNGSLIGLKY